MRFGPRSVVQLPSHDATEISRPRERLRQSTRCFRYSFSTTDKHAIEVNEARREFVALSQTSGLPFIDHALYDTYLVTCCTAASQSTASHTNQQFDDSQASRAFIPTVDVLQDLNLILRQQQRLAIEALDAATRREATVHVILTETCAAARGIFPHNNATSKDILCTAATHERLATLLRQLDERTDDVVSRIRSWRRNLHNPQPFFVNGENYLLRVRRQIDSVVSRCHLHLQAAQDQLQRSNPANFDTSNEYTSYYLDRSARTDHTFSSFFAAEDERHEVSSSAYLDSLSSSRRRASTVRGDKSSELVRMIFNEYNLQQRYVAESLLRTAQCRYSLCLKNTIDINHTDGLDCSDLRVLRRGACSRIRVWFPLPFIVALPLDDDDTVAPIVGARHVDFVAVDENGCVPFHLMRHLFYPSPSEVDTSNLSTRYGVQFNGYVQSWISKCLSASQTALDNLFDDAETSIATDDQRMRNDALRLLTQKSQRQRALFFFSQWQAFLIVNGRRRRQLHRLNAMTALHLRRRYWARWDARTRSKLSRGMCAASLLATNERRQCYRRFMCLLHFRLVRLVSRSLSGKLFQRYFGRWMFLVLSKRAEHASHVAEAAWGEQHRQAWARSSGEPPLMCIPPPQSLQYLYCVSFCSRTDSVSLRSPKHRPDGSVRMPQEQHLEGRRQPLIHLRTVYQSGVAHRLSQTA